MKIRLDQLLVESGLAESRERAQRLIRAGLVLVDEQRIDKPGRNVDRGARIRLKGEVCPYVSRGGLKLGAALKKFGLTDLSGHRALDVGASTGGFTDCLLRHGAAHVWSIDTGRGQFHAGLRSDPRITLRERANARYLTPDWVDGQRIDLVAVDVSFISLQLILPPVMTVLAGEGTALALIKPQFEAGPEDVGRGGVVRDRAVHRRVLDEMIGFCHRREWQVSGLMPSPLPGPAGNLEFFLRLSLAEPAPSRTDIDIEGVLDEAYTLLRRLAPPSSENAGRADVRADKGSTT